LPSGCHATLRAHPVLKDEFGIGWLSSFLGQARANTSLPFPGVMFQRRKVPSSEHVASLFTSLG
jgi:hypothetical protein